LFLLQAERNAVSPRADLDPDSSETDGIARELAEGRTTRTPFLILGSVAVTVLAFSAAITLIVFAVWWLL
jgi:hypothetical protein